MTGNTKHSPALVEHFGNVDYALSGCGFIKQLTYHSGTWSGCCGTGILTSEGRYNGVLLKGFTPSKWDTLDFKNLEGELLDEACALYVKKHGIRCKGTFKDLKAYFLKYGNYTDDSIKEHLKNGLASPQLAYVNKQWLVAANLPLEEALEILHPDPESHKKAEGFQVEDEQSGTWSFVWRTNTSVDEKGTSQL